MRWRNESEPSTVAPCAYARSDNHRSDVTIRIEWGSASAFSRRMISWSAASRRGRGAWVTSTTVERIGGRVGARRRR